MLFKMAWLNLFRNKRRSLATLFVIAIGAAALMVIGGFGMNTYRGLAQQSARDTGNLIMANEKYFSKSEDKLMDFGLSNYKPAMDILKNNPSYKYVLPVVKFQGLISNDDKSTIFLGRGIDSAEIRARGPFIELLSGDSLSRKFDINEAPQVLLGYKLAEELNAKPKTILTMLSDTTEGSLNGFDVEVVGTFTTGVPAMDKRLVLTHIENSQSLLITDKVSFISLHLNDFETNAEEQVKLKKEYPQFHVFIWSELAFFYEKVKQLYNNIFTFIGVVVALIIFFSISNTMHMAVWERVREIGTIGAMGASRKEIITSFMLEGFYISVIGSFLAFLLTSAISITFLFSDLQMAPPPGRTASYPLQIDVVPVLCALVALSILIISVVASYFAAKRAANLPIVDSLSHI